MKHLPITQIMRAAEAAFDETCQEAAAACTTAIESAVWQWNGVTVRYNGSTVGSPRDIVDTGALRDSQKLIKISAGSYLLVYSAGYATDVHNGVTLRSGHNLPARPWTQRAIGNNDRSILNFPKYFTQRLNERL